MKSVSTRLIKKHGGAWYGRMQGEIDFYQYKKEQRENHRLIAMANGSESNRKTMEYLETSRRG